MVELRWDGKYDKQGKRVAPLRVALPFQTVETVNEDANTRNLALDLFGAGKPAHWRNRLIWGDKKYVLPSLLPEFAGKVDLIYIDPPFATGQDFSFQVSIEGDTFEKQPSIIEQKAYRDTFGRGLDGYYDWFYQSASILYELLSNRGVIYVHCDYHVNSGIRIILDEIFGPQNLINEITWKRTNVHSHALQGTTHFARIQDTIFLYSKTSEYIWNQLYVPFDSEYAEANYKHIEEGTWRRYSLGDLTATDGGRKGNPRFEFLGVTRYWRYNKEKMEDLHREGRIVQTSPGSVPRQKRYFDESKGVEVSSLWTDISPVSSQANERVGYPTQKPETLLERIINASSNEGDLVLDCFAGSGTTAAVAEKLGRRWITCDLGRFAIHTTRKRLLSIPNVKPFEVQNLGKYERQAWQAAEFGSPEKAAAQMQAYRQFILQLYGARPVEGYTWLHGIKSGRMVHVGAVDAPVSVGDVQQVVIEFRKAQGSGADAPSTAAVDVLGWDFAFELNEVAIQQAREAGVGVRFLQIPREVLEKRAVEQGDIRFFELAALGVETKVKGRALTVTLTDFMIPPDDVPQEIREAITHWSQWIDYWAIDWEYKGDAFHNQWQIYRTRKEKKLLLATNHHYAEPGTYRVMVKVIDILGNDTTKLIEVKAT